MMTDTVATEGLVDLYCRQLKLPGIRANYRELAREALDNGISPMRFLIACFEQELATRQEQRLNRRMRTARFPALKTLNMFDFSAIPSLPKAKVFSLAEAGFVRQKENLICIGPSGTGKTHILIALGMAAIEAGFQVRFIRTVALAQDLLQAQEELRLNRYLNSWHKVDLVLLDELGYIGLGQGGPLLFQFIADRYESGSVALSSNLEFSRWEEVFGDPALTTALLDRLTHRSHILQFHGDSYRLKESRRRLKDDQTTAIIRTGEPTV